MKEFILKASLFSFLFLSGFFRPRAQAGMATHYPEIGKPLPDITLTNVDNYKLKKVTTKDFKGKWTILDFWCAGCTVCVAGFHHTDIMQKKYGNSLQIFLVGQTGGSGEKSLHQLYEKYQKRYSLNLPNVYDSLLEHYFGIKGYPYVVWIDNHGIVQAITYGSELNDKNIEKFIKGEQLNLREAESAKISKINGYQYDQSRPIFLNDNGGPDSAFLYRSMLTKWANNTPVGMSDHIGDVYSWNDNDVFETVGAGLNWLYKLAYSGTFYYRPGDSLYQIFYTDPVLEVADPKPFDISADDGKYRYCYNFIFPAKKYSAKYVQEALQRDLNKYFGYQVNVETRMMPCWKLTCDDSARNNLRTNGALPDSLSQIGSTNKWVTHNGTVKGIIEGIWGLYQAEDPIVDETGIDFNVDLEIDGIITDFEDLKKELSKKGLHLIKGQKQMKVIVIRDAPGSN